MPHAAVTINWKYVHPTPTILRAHKTSKFTSSRLPLSLSFPSVVNWNIFREWVFVCRAVCADSCVSKFLSTAKLPATEIACNFELNSVRRQVSAWNSQWRPTVKTSMKWWNLNQAENFQSKTTTIAWNGFAMTCMFDSKIFKISQSLFWMELSAVLIEIIILCSNLSADAMLQFFKV